MNGRGSQQLDGMKRTRESLILLGVSGAVCLERLGRELGRAYRTKSLIYKGDRSDKVSYRQSEELIVVISPRTT